MSSTVPSDPQPAARPPRRRDSYRSLILRAVVLFWVGYIVVNVAQDVWGRLYSFIVVLMVAFFFSLAIEPAVNRLAKRGWPRGRSTALIMVIAFLGVVIFAAAIGTLIVSQVVNLLQNSEAYITDTVATINDWFGTRLDAQQVVEEFNRDDGPVQRFIRAQSDQVVGLSATALNVVLQVGAIILFAYYLVADGPRLRRAILSRLPPTRQRQVLNTWELAINKTGGYLYSRALLAVLSTVYHWIVFQIVGTTAPLALAVFVGLVSQFLPVFGTYLAGLLPVLISFLDSPTKAIIVLAAIIMYQQLENYLIAPRVTARTMELHPAVAFAAALVGISLMGVVGAILALPAAAMAQAFFSQWGKRHEVIDSDLIGTDDTVAPTDHELS